MKTERGRNDGSRPSFPGQHDCKSCGSFCAPMAILDTREGKSYRLHRCLGCEKMSWAEEQ
jgi:hypothetical protein